MAEEQQIILEINVKDSLTKTAELKASINELISQRQQLAEAAKKGDEDAAKGLEAVNVAVRLQQQEYRTQTKILDGYVASKKSEVDTLKFSNNSIQQNRDLLKQLTAQYITLKSPSAEATKQIKDLSDALKSQEGAIGDNRRSVGAYKEAFVGAFQSITSSVPALKGFQTAQLGVNAAMDANPIGAVVLLLQSLFEIFSKNKAVADEVSFAIAGLEKGFGSIVDTIVNTVTNFDKLTEAIKHPIDFLLNLGKATAQAAKEGHNASKAFDELTVSNAKLNAEIGIGQEKADALTKSLKDRTKSEKERIGIANQIADLEISNARKLADLRQKELDALKLQNKERTLSGEEQAKEIEKQGQVEIANLQAVTIENQRQTRINILLDKQATTNAKDASKEKIKIKEDELKSLEGILAKEKEAKDKAFEDETNSLLNAEVKQAEITARRVGSVSALVDAENIARERLLQNEKLNATERENIIRESEDKIKKIKEDGAKVEVINEKKKQDQILSLIQYGLTQAATVVGLVSQALQQGSQERLDSFKANAEAEKAALSDQLDNGRISKKKYNQDIAKIDADARNKEAAEKKKQWEIAKGVQITNAIIQTAQATISAFNAGASYGPAGVVLGPVFAGIAAALGAVQIGIIAAQQPPKFAKGIIGLDGKGTETSDDIPAYLSKGESVVTAKATRRFHRELAAMEMAVGNSPNYNFGKGMFASGFIPTIEGDGGFSARDISNRVEQSTMLQEAIRNGFALAPAPKLSIVEFESKQNNRNRSVNISEA